MARINVPETTVNQQIEFLTDNYSAYFSSSMSAVDTQLHSCLKVDESCVIHLVQIHHYFHAFRELLDQHLGESDYLIFPIVRKITAKQLPASETQLFVKSLDRFLGEHRELKNLMLQLDIMTDHFTCPGGCSPTLKGCYAEMKNIKTQYFSYAEAELLFLQPKLAFYSKQIQ